MSSTDCLDLEFFYAYGHEGRSMMAVRAPFATSDSAPDLIGRIALINKRYYEIMAVARQVIGPIAKGEPMGLEVRPVAEHKVH